MNAVRSIVVGLVCMSVIVVTARSAVGAQVDHFVEYVETTGAQWVPVHHRLTGSTRVEVDVKVKVDGTWKNTVFSARGEDKADAYCLRYRTNKYGWALDIASSVDVTPPDLGVIDCTRVHHLVVKASGVCDDTGKIWNAKSVDTRFVSRNELILFATGGTSWPNPAEPNAADMRGGELFFYGLKAYDDGKLVLDLRPCVDTDGVAAIYNATSGELCYNQTATSLTAGEPVETATDLLPIKGDPIAFGKVSPGYGVVTGLQAGATLTLEAPLACTNAAGAYVAQLVGYRHLTNGVVCAEGTSGSYVYTHDPSALSSFEWLWKGAATRPVTWVAELGDDETADGSEEHPYGNIQTAIDATPDYGTVLVGPGTYRATKAAGPMTVLRLLNANNCPVTVASVAGPAQTLLDCHVTTNYAWVSGNVRLAQITDPDAVLEGLTLMWGCVVNKSVENICEISSGLMTNCVFRWLKQVDHEGAVKVTGNGRIVDTVIDCRGMSVVTGTSSRQYALSLSGNAVADGVEVRNFSFGMPKKTSSKKSSPVYLDSANAVLRRSFIHDNDVGGATPSSAFGGGGVQLVNGTVDHCTIVANSTAGTGGGILVAGTSDCVVSNTIVWGNAALMQSGVDVISASATGVFRYSCASSFEDVKDGAGEGCTTSDPLFSTREPYHLTIPSLILHDDMGCFPLESGAVDTPTVMIDVKTDDIREGVEVTFAATASASAGACSYSWDFGDGSEPDEGDLVTHAYPVAGPYVVTLTATREAGGETLTATTEVAVVGSTCYVSSSGGNRAPYASWADAATSLNDALQLRPETIVVTNGTYELPEGGIVFTSPMVLKSVEGPDKTTLRSPVTTRVHARTLANSKSGVSVSGFTFTGATSRITDVHQALLSLSAGEVSNCCFRFNALADRESFAIVSGSARIVDTVFDYTGGYFNRGAKESTGYLYCGLRIEGNAVVDRCVIRGLVEPNVINSTPQAPVRIDGAGAILRNSLVTGCTNGTALAANDFVQGPGGVYLVNGRVENCTIVGNKSAGKGGGLLVAAGCAGAVENTIVWGNDTQEEDCANIWDRTANGVVAHSCSPDLPDPAPHDPRFVDAANGDYTLKFGSPCVNTGIKLDYTAESLDLAGRQRIFNFGKRSGKPDMGCYESPWVNSGLTLLVR